MKRRLLFRITISLAAVLFAPFSLNFNVYAQGGDAKLTPKPTPAPKTGAKITKPAAPVAPTTPVTPVTPTLVYNEESKGTLDPKLSATGAGGGLFEELILNVKGDEALTFHLQSENAALGLQIFDKDKKEIALTKDASGEFKVSSPSGALPGEGEYRIRVTAAAGGKTAIPYTVKVNRLGLTGNAYNERFNNVYAAYAALPEGNSAALDETLAKLEELARDDENRATTFELLGIVYLYNKHDAAKAGQAMEQAIKLKGAAVVKISHDSQWRRMAKLKSGNMGWEDARTGWLRIRPGQVALTDPSNKTLASLNGAQIKELSKILTATSNLVTITADNVRKPFIFAPGSGQQDEADLVIKLIQNYVMGKAN